MIYNSDDHGLEARRPKPRWECMKKPTDSSVASTDSQASESPRRRGNRSSRVPQILDVSIKVFIEAGYSGYTINRVASEAGIRLSTLQYYFSNREELLRVTIEEIARRYFDRFNELATQESLSPKARLEAVLDDALAVYARPDLPASIFESWALALHEEFARDIIVNIQRQFEGLFTRLVGEINPALSSKQRALRGALILSSLQGMIVFLRWDADEFAGHQAFRTAAKRVWNELVS